MKTKFRLEDYEGDYVMHCKTLDEAFAFCKFMHESGKMWSSDSSYLDNINWEKYKTKTCYDFNICEFCSLNYYKIRNKTILEYSDFDWSKQFTKSDLQDFDFVVSRSGEVFRYNTNFNEFITIEGISLNLRGYTDNLSHIDCFNYDIIKVYRPNFPYQCCFNEYREGKLIYKREETVEMTLEEICKELGKNVKIVR